MGESKMKNLRSITTVLVCFAVVFSFFVSIIRVFGFRVYGVLSGSMEPAYPVGSLIYVRNVNPDDLRIGDAITFSLSPNVIATHRIVGIVPDENNPAYRRFQTKGDANRSVDSSLVSPSNIIGKVAFSLPYLGTITNYIQNPPGTYVAILVGAVLIFLVLLTDSKASKKVPFLKKKDEPLPSEPQSVNAGMPRAQQTLYPAQNINVVSRQPIGGYQQQMPPQRPVNEYSMQAAPMQPQYRSPQQFNPYPQQPQEQYPRRPVYPQYRQPQGGYYPQQGNGYQQPQQPFAQPVPPPVQYAQPQQFSIPADDCPASSQADAPAPRRRRSGNHQA